MNVDPGFKRKIDDWNAGHPNHPPVMVRWEPHAVLVRKYVWIYGVSIPRWEYQPRWQVGVVLPNKHKGPVMYLEGSGGLWFLKLFNWQMQGTKEFLDLDDRIFGCLVDSTPHQFYEERIEKPAAESEERSRVEGRALTHAGSSHYFGYDKLTINPNVPAGGNWRWRNR